jgi:diaminohydroxyphosphoribosylaminopyrimidine deaminase/5-amino-6-(5-phosphoribosylamino)uracil reductase
MLDEQYMRRALELAERGLGKASPNPMVGCVIVHDDKIIGEGWHKYFGEAHAEVNAVNSVENQDLLSSSTLYLTLEPCSYHGKTPACTDLLIKHKVKKVIIAAIDPNPKVSGTGIKLLKAAGIEVTTGLLESDSITLNKRFQVNITQQRTYVILKWAQTADGFLARENHDAKWISNEYSRQLVHKWRSEEDAIMVGKNTVKYDNPSLTVRDWSGANPVRVVLDRNLSLPEDYCVKDGQEETIIYNLIESREEDKIHFIKLDEDDFLPAVFQDLYQRGMGSVLVEGGAKVLNTIINLGLWDEARIFYSEIRFGAGIAAPAMPVFSNKEHDVMGDRLKIFINN